MNKPASPAILMRSAIAVLALCLFFQERCQPAEGLRCHRVDSFIRHKAMRFDFAILCKRIDQYMHGAHFLQPF